MGSAEISSRSFSDSLAQFDSNYINQSAQMSYTFTDNAGEEGIRDFLASTDDTFYAECGNWFARSDLERLKIELPVFFSSEHFLVRHYFGDEIVSYLLFVELSSILCYWLTFSISVIGESEKAET